MLQKKILIDLGKLKDRFSGLGEMSYNFGLNIVENIELLSKNNIAVYFLVPKQYVGAFGNKVKYIPLNFMFRHFPWLYKSFDLWYASHQDSSYMPGNKSCKFIMTIHDLNVSYHPNKIKAQLRLNGIQKKMERCDVIISNSNFTKNEIIKKLIPKKDINVIYCGCADFSKLDPVRPGQLPDIQNFYLHISTITPKKNTRSLVDLMKIMPECKLVIAGSWNTEYAKDIIKEIEKSKISNIIKLDNVSNEEKAWLYQNCKALFFPSFLEGFGLPVIESMYCGKPVFSSTCTSLPEIGSDKAFYWESFDPEEMKKIVEEKIAFAENDPHFSNRLKEYAQNFNWTENILQYIHLFINVLKEKD